MSPLTLKSTLVTRKQLGIAAEMAIKAQAEAKLLEMAHAALGSGKRLVIRDLTPQDLQLSNNEWVEESGADNTWADTTITGDMADNRFVAILGMYFGRGYTTPPVSAWRFNVGGSVVALWDLYQLVPRMVDPGGDHPPVGIAEAPVFISQNTPFTVQEYSIEATTAYHPRILGLVCEPEGKTIKG